MHILTPLNIKKNQKNPLAIPKLLFLKIKEKDFMRSEFFSFIFSPFLQMFAFN